MIGVFDSGVGGLSVLRAIREELPKADVVYFGDIKHAPYGVRTQEELSVLTFEAIRLLQQEGANHIVSACNSVSASLVMSLFDTLAITPQQLIEMVGPTALHFRDSDARLALCATPATIKSGIYQNAFRMLGKEVSYIAIPDLAGAVEFGKSEAEIERIISEAFADAPSFDTLILSCTHYPLVRDVFVRVLGQGVQVFDPSTVVAKRAKDTFIEESDGSGKTRFIISTDTDQFRALVAKFFPEGSYTIEVQS